MKTVKAGAPLFTLIYSLIAIAIIGVECVIPAGIICIFFCAICHAQITAKAFCIVLAVLTLIFSAIPARQPNRIVVNLPKQINL